MTTMMYADAAANDETWIQEMRVEHTQQMRADLVRLVNSHCYKTNTKQQDVWRSLYAKLGIPLPAKKRLDYIEEQGKIGDILRIAREL